MRYFKITIIVLFLLTNCNDASDNTGGNPNQTKSNQNDALVFKRINEPKENAFSIFLQPAQNLTTPPPPLIQQQKKFTSPPP